MSFKNRFAKFSGRFVKYLLSTFTDGGSSLPGKVASRISPNILRDFAKDYEVIVITGTNGKTLTTSLITSIFKRKYDNVLTNRQGSNMQQGIVGAFLDAKRSKEKGIAIIEVDEGTLKHVIPALNPKYIIYTNLFEDQTDRYGDTKAAYQLLTDAAKSVPNAKIIRNADLPLFNTIKLPNHTINFGVDTSMKVSNVIHACPCCGHKLHYEKYTFSAQGDYYCDNCGLKRPELHYKVTEVISMTQSESIFKIDRHLFSLPVAGLYNIYNALAAYSIAREYNIEIKDIQSSFENTKRVFGRQELISFGDKTALLNVVKNPVGLNQVLSLIEKEPGKMTFVALLNNRPADGVDLSWLDNGNFEILSDLNIDHILTGGIRADRMTERLVEVGVERYLIDEYSDLNELVRSLKRTKNKNIQIIATYTAMLEFRKALKEENIL